MDKLINHLKRYTDLNEDEIRSEIAIKIDAINKSYDGKGGYDSYVRLCMYRHFIAMRRKKQLPIANIDPDRVATHDKDNRDDKHWIAKLKDLLSERDYQIVYARFAEDKTLAEVGKEVGLSRESVRQVIAKLMHKVKRKKLDKLYQKGEK